MPAAGLRSDTALMGRNRHLQSPENSKLVSMFESALTVQTDENNYQGVTNALSLWWSGVPMPIAILIL